LAVDPSGSFLVIADDRNSALRKITFDGAVATIAKSTMHMNHLVDSQWWTIRPQVSTGTVPAHVCTFMHPTSVDFDSRGRLLFACHHEHSIRRYDFAAKTISVVRFLYDNALDTNYPNFLINWPILRVDRWGAVGPVDRIYVNSWAQASDRIYAPDGSALPWKQDYYSGQSSTLWGGCGLDWGQVDHCAHRGYPWALEIDPDGAMLHSGHIGGGLFLIRARHADDGPDVDPRKFVRGEALHTTSPDRTTPPLYLLHGRRGKSMLADNGFQWLMDQPDPAAVVSAWRPSWKDAQVDDYLYYAERCCQCCVAGTFEPPPVDPPPVDPPPVDPPPVDPPVPGGDP
jgi:hypothetical protein